jgi:hypothetical protein
MVNRFFAPEVEWPRDKPRRIYALLADDDDEKLLFEAVDADWFDDVGEIRAGSLRLWREFASGAPLYVLETPASALEPEGVSPGRRDRWVEIEIHAGSGEGLLYNNLFAAPTTTSFRIASVSHRKARALLRWFSLKPYVSSTTDISKALSNLRGPHVEWIGVYDVGQGSANGLCDGSGMPLAYYDLGGAVLGNAGTFPSALTGLCLTHTPPVILSHWDWDHWSSGSRFPQAQQMTWIVPYQRLGAVHATFAADVAANGRLLVWPPALRSVEVGQLTIEKCRHKGRNHSGLAGHVTGPKGELPILLPGDARYSAIPSGHASYTSVVVPHHGADMKLKATPVCPALPASRLAYSYGQNNCYGHPRQVTYANHSVNGWAHSAAGVPGSVDLHTCNRGGAGLGHVALGWTGTARLPRQPCRQSICKLQLIQS